MISLPYILKFKYPDIDFDVQVTLADWGNGPEINEWHRVEPRPSLNDLAEWATQYDLQYRQAKAAEQRVYPSIGDQLDMLYKDQLNGTTVWRDSITAVKLAHPKPIV